MDAFFNLVLVLVLTYEGIAIWTKKRGDTISEHSWDLRDYLWGRIVVDTLLIWLLWHITVDDTFFIQGPSWVDAIIVVGAIYWAWWSFNWEKTNGISGK